MELVESAEILSPANPVSTWFVGSGELFFRVRFPATSLTDMCNGSMARSTGRCLLCVGKAALVPPKLTLLLTKQALRACFAELRVRMVLYALSHEKDLLYRPLRQGMGLPEDPSSSIEATEHDACSFPARDLRRDLLRLEKRLSLAAIAR